MSDASRLEFVQQVLHILYMTEFLLLLELTEVVVPVAYSIYFGLTFYLPNRAYYAQHRDIDAAKLLGNIGNILVYGVLEACSLAFLSQVQSKLVFWVIFTLQAPLAHFGVGFSFKFAWLKTNIPAS
uniref:Uncharacterized protein n=1 Tax=Globisporangium ultimum (strain ATCC 200006 / CBS 805.95 / DAOM BR144) TaxID=431595 RepID=K3X2L7_GLOUD